INSTAFVLNNLTGDTIYAFSSWIKITGADSALIKATLTTDHITFNCTGTVVAKNGCWSFLKGGFVLESPLNINAFIYFQNVDGQQIKVSVSSASIQPFTRQQWEKNQQRVINTERKRTTTLHVSDVDGNKLHGAKVVVNQVSRDFPFGTAISALILGNKQYQKWFLERFNAAVFENELKWNETEPQRGKVNYTIPDQMLQLLRTKQITVRGHNVLWESHNMVPPWAKNLTTSELKSAVRSRIHSVMKRYKNEFVHWDVNNEMLPWDFYEQRLGLNASVEIFRAAQGLDPRARMFMNEFNVLENCNGQCAVDKYVERLRELVDNGVSNFGIGLQSHFYVPNPALIRGVIDKLATLKLPIWLTELDISKKIDDEQLKAKYLEVALREGFSHPSVNGIMLWTAWHPNEADCYRTCLQDDKFKNHPTGDTVDKLLKEWQTRKVKGKTDRHGIFNFSGFLGDYKVIVKHMNKTTETTLSLGRGHETKHWNIYL
ncbi:endo-1 4-beta-xylanase a, partial [Phtheirospermum japonicum]